MVEIGMPAIEAIQSATMTAAMILKMDSQIGSLQSDKLADIIAVPGNPLQDVSVLENVSFVMKEGVIHKHN